ncbi:glycosyltransferase family A protein [Pseudoflavonifractor sp. CLA-AP-H29]|uniref:Glycosyltransferase family A protein n=1 Tax=Pseudoflavonifractor intestinihominis TaxID=3133171 RepID=A0ABV1ECI8_9FIRM
MNKLICSDIGISTPWLSVIVPMYNAQAYLDQTILSILSQTFQDYELLLVDDGSTDGTADICARYAARDRRIRYLKKTNGGSYQTRLYGAQRAQGTYVMFCDADDYYASSRAFSIIYKKLQSHPCDAMQFGYSKKYNHLRKAQRTVRADIHLDRDAFMKQEYPKLLCSFWDEANLKVIVFNKVYHHCLLNNLPPANQAERLFWGDDQVMNMYLLETCRSFSFIPDTLYVYRQGSGGTNRFSLRTLQDINIIKHYQLSFIEKHPEYPRSTLENILFSELAGWTFCYICQGIGHLPDEQLKSLIAEAMELPSYRAAREHYLNRSNEKWDAVNLLRQANPDAYLEAAKKAADKKEDLKSSIISLAKNIYRNI